jgi:hypothetical protein
MASRESQTANQIANSDNTQPPPTAATAPKGNTAEVFTGLTEALNTNAQRLAKEKKYTKADEYVIEFAAGIGSAKVKRQGTTNKNATPSQNPTTANQKLNPTTNSLNTNARTIQVTAGMQIVQFIDQVIRTSTYITDQQKYIVDEETQKTKPNPNASNNGVTAWYKINVEAVPLGYDEKRRDHAYRMKFVITPYAINQAPSDWFNPPRYRGSHKSYNYWFTGANKEVLSFEQEYNSLYRLIISGSGIPTQGQMSDMRDQYRRVYMPTSENHAKGGEGYANEGGDNLASYLYSPTDQAKAKLRIVGDPAWMQQGEVSTGVNARTFNFSPFNDDGTINYDSQEVVFDISWNRPADYNFNTGLMDLNRSNYNPDGSYSNQPQENATYTAIKCKNIFSKGKFEQELEGRLMIDFKRQPQATDAGRPAINNVATTGSSRPALASSSGTVGGANYNSNLPPGQWYDQNGLLVLGEDLAAGEENQEDGVLTPIPSPETEPSTSDGNIEDLGGGSVAEAQTDQSEQSVDSPDYESGLAGTTGGTEQFMDREA